MVRWWRVRAGWRKVAARDPVLNCAAARHDQSASDIPLVKNSALQWLPSRRTRGRSERGPNYFQVYAYGWGKVLSSAAPPAGQAAGGAAGVVVSGEKKNSS